MREPWHDVAKINVLLDSNLNPSLIEKWGWSDDVLELIGESPLR